MEGVSSPLWPDRRMANHHSCRTRFATRSGCGARWADRMRPRRWDAPP